MSCIDYLIKRKTGFASAEQWDISIYRLQCYKKYDKSIGNNGSFKCKFSKSKKNLQVAVIDKYINVFNVKSLRHNEIYHYNKMTLLQDFYWLSDQILVLLSGSEIYLADLEIGLAGHEKTITSTFSKNFEKGILNQIINPCHQDIIASGWDDSSIVLRDMRTPQEKPVDSIFHTHCDEKNVPQSLTDLIYYNRTIISCSLNDDTIKFWDIRMIYHSNKRKTEPFYQITGTNNNAKNKTTGISSLYLNPIDKTIYANYMNGNIDSFNISSYDYDALPIGKYYGHNNSSSLISSCLSPDGKYLLSGSTDKFAYIWRTNKPGSPIVKLSGHDYDMITSVDWSGSTDETWITTCSMDSSNIYPNNCSLHVWRVGTDDDNDDVDDIGRAQQIKNPIFHNEDSTKKYFIIQQ
ncbi:hypothetical protein HCN44_006825 [Aphidius gifuensis]|uniref:Uncharacterized protein n=1 Tax=Aphidius gifuensis TaxID=684658 RepID=A0A835CVU5_APHGI|nr:denticleless protein homolog [Aphidius gifuensis]KAF7995718.1 hypothetical protein HCN44_006825 [Aphidius gifuensis]